MELRVLQYFLAVAREQSISAAAQSLHLTQPTLSRQLRELEEELGMYLVWKKSRIFSGAAALFLDYLLGTGRGSGHGSAGSFGAPAGAAVPSADR